MAADLTPKAFSSAAPAGLIAECNRMAAEAARLAMETTGELRSAYEHLSEQWISLAKEVEDFAAGHSQYNAPHQSNTEST